MQGTTTEYRIMPGRAGAFGVEGSRAIEEKLKVCINICFPVPREMLRGEKNQMKPGVRKERGLSS